MRNVSGIPLKVHIALPSDGDPELVDNAARALVVDLRDVGIMASVPSGQPSPGTKGDPVTLGSLAVAVLPGLLPVLIKAIHTWCSSRRRTAKVKVKASAGTRRLELEFTPGSISQADLDRAIKAAAQFVEETSSQTGSPS
jgi:hypothetical protein